MQLLNSIRDELESKYTQKPQLSCSHPLSKWFPFPVQKSSVTGYETNASVPRHGPSVCNVGKARIKSNWYGQGQDQGKSQGMGVAWALARVWVWACEMACSHVLGRETPTLDSINAINSPRNIFWGTVRLRMGSLNEVKALITQGL